MYLITDHNLYGKFEGFSEKNIFYQWVVFAFVIGSSPDMY